MAFHRRLGRPADHAGGDADPVLPDRLRHAAGAGVPPAAHRCQPAGPAAIRPSSGRDGADRAEGALPAGRGGAPHAVPAALCLPQRSDDRARRPESWHDRDCPALGRDGGRLIPATASAYSGKTTAGMGMHNSLAVGIAAAFASVAIGAGWQVATRLGTTTSLQPVDLALL